MRAGLRSGVVAALLASWSAAAGADEPEPAAAAAGGGAPAGGSSSAPAEPAPKPARNPLARMLDDPELEIGVHGRLLVGATADERADYARSFSMGEARISLEARRGWLDTVIEADLAEDRPVKDAFVRLSRGDRSLRLTAGRFKPPFLERELESSWTLPLADRGLVNDYLVDVNGLGGRRIGVMGEARAKRAMAFGAQAGVFAGEERENGAPPEEDAAGRVWVKPARWVTVTGSGYLSGAFGARAQRAASGAAELRLGPAQATAEVTAGRVLAGPFTAGTVLVTWTIPAGAGWRLEPLVAAETIRVRGSTPGRGHGVVAGMNALRGERFKVRLQGERALRSGDAREATSLTVQLGTRF